MQKYETIFSQAESVDTNEAYEERNKIYKSMNFEEIMNLINEIKEVSSLIVINTQEFNLNTSAISAISNEIKSMDKIAECLTTISEIRRIKDI